VGEGKGVWREKDGGENTNTREFPLGGKGGEAERAGRGGRNRRMLH